MTTVQTHSRYFRGPRTAGYLFASKYNLPFALKNVPPKPSQVFEVKHRFSAGVDRSRMQISGSVGSSFDENQHFSQTARPPKA